jgi:hypothetical protein
MRGLSYGRRGSRPPRRHSRTGLEAFALIRLFSIRVFVIDTISRGLHRGNEHEIITGCHTCYRFCHRCGDALPAHYHR